MNKLFIHNPIFRIISPLSSGALVYLLILLVNNNVGQLQDEFLGQELYVCIGLSYLIQEYSRISLFFFEKLKQPASLIGKIILQILISVIASVILVSGSMYLYFEIALGFTPNLSELILFNSIFSVITIIYLSLYLSHQFLYKVNIEILNRELSIKENIDQDFVQFKKGINPKLLFESFEALILLIKKDADKAEQYIDYFSAVYRYILSRTSKELVPVKEELMVLEQLLLLFENLPYRKAKCTVVESIDSWVVPGSILSCAEEIIRSTITSQDNELNIEIFTDSDHILIKYPHQEKITYTMQYQNIEDIIELYRFYTTKKITITKDDIYKVISIPKLTINESSDN
ncbi:histidine kinase [Aquimarina sp. 2201CG5-10]|uniref:histidine kinase n=1 Tax=Aquimarina callyspongiae TaxID=3098150 RepID=UPI002AB45AF4|nr:histidine kinase [Aquimarina sp. 2201CG5-10]MDY8136752.1 histidine kinase [Aquimarina sp. 2201CG5-10]